MKLPRRHFLHLTMGAAALPAALRTASAETYPSRPARIVVGFAAGGSGDILARVLAQWLSDRLKQSFFVENKVGAGGNLATDSVLRLPPDGYTLMMVTMPTIITAPLPADFDLARNSTPVAGCYQAYLVMLVNPSVPAKTLPEFIAYAKANPGKLSMGSAGIGTAPHLSGELFKMMTGIDMIHVPYRGGGPALIDLLGDQVQVMFSNLPVAEYIRAGKLRALAVTTATRAASLPDIPAVGEIVPGYEASVVFGVCGPEGMPADIVEKLNAEINVGLTDPKVQARLADLGAEALVLSPAGFGKFIAEETAKWDKVARAAHVRPG